MQVRPPTHARNLGEASARFLADASELLSSSLDYGATLQNLAGIAVPTLADWCFVHVRREDGSFELIAIGHADPERAELVREVARRWPLQADAPAGYPKVIRTRQPELLSSVPEPLLASIARDPEHLRALRALALRSQVCAPLVARGQALGSLTLATAESGRVYGADDLAFAVELARRAALFVDNARVHRELRRAADLHAAELERRIAERTAELQAFAWTISHDLRAPARAVAGLGEALLEDHGAVLPEEGRELLVRIIDAARRMDAMVQGLLEYGRLGHGEVRREWVDLSVAIDDARERIGHEARARGARVTASIPPLRVLADREVLARVIDNLLDNALKFVAPGVRPELAVAAERVAGGRVRLSIDDNGIGIEPEHHERVFRMFERLYGRDAYPGTGVGLAIVKRGLERMGGRVGVESRFGGGSRFWIELDGDPGVAAGAPS